MGVEEGKETAFVGVGQDGRMLCREFDVVDRVDWREGLSAGFCEDD